MCETARRYSLSEVHAFLCRNASQIDNWLPEAVKISLQELEKVVSDNGTTAQVNVYSNRHGGGNWRGGNRIHRGHHDSGKSGGAPQWKNDSWDNFRIFKETKVISTKTPTTRFRAMFNKLTEAKLTDTVNHVAELLLVVLDDKELHGMANVILDVTKASSGNANLYAAFLRGLQLASGEGPVHSKPSEEMKTQVLANITMDKLRAECVTNTTKAVQPEDDSYDAMCVANAINDNNTTCLKLAVLCEKHQVLKAGSTALLLKRLAKKLTKLGTKAEDKNTIEVLTSRLVSVLEATNTTPNPEVREAIDIVLKHCENRTEYPGLKNKVQFTLMDYLDTLNVQ